MATSDERRAPVQGDRGRYGKAPGGPPGTISWAEHEEAWRDYHKRYSYQDAETIAARGGFGYWELCDHLGYEPKTWTPR